MKFRVETSTWTYQEWDNLQEAEEQYEVVKDTKMSEGVDEDTFVQLVSSENDFEDYQVIKRAIVVYDEERMAKSTPREEGHDFDFWAKWQEECVA